VWGKVCCGEQQRFYPQETALQLQCYKMEVEEIQCAVTRELNSIKKIASL
jgi:hypothetical protein